MATQTDLERLTAWLQTWDGYSNLRDMQIDYTDQIPGIFGLFPTGLTTTGSEDYIDGSRVLYNQYNFAVYTIFAKAPGDGTSSAGNAEWVMNLQRWIQEQSMAHSAPTFGNVDQSLEEISASNGQLYDANAEGTALYMVQITASFHTYYDP